MCHSGRFSTNSATLSPGPIPAPARRAAVSRVARSNSFTVYARHDFPARMRSSSLRAG